MAVRARVCAHVCVRTLVADEQRKDGWVTEHLPSLDLYSFSIDLSCFVSSLAQVGGGAPGSLRPPMKSSGGWQLCPEMWTLMKLPLSPSGSSPGREKCSTLPGCN